MSFDPRNTRAFVVGIEKYGFGESWNLPGPVADAHRFVDWLVACGVPPGNITAFLTEPVLRLPENVPALPAAVSRRSATRAEFISALTQELPVAGPDVFWLWWGGHGVVQSDQKRALFFSDATALYPITLQWRELELFLRSAATDQMAAFRRILAIVDACSTYAHLTGLPAQLPHDQLGGGNPVPGREVVVLCSSQSGQAARNLAAEQTGLLAREIFPRLKALVGQAWPPDLAEVAQELRRHFLELNKQGTTAQLPACYGYESPAGAEPDLRFNPPRALSVTDKGKLRDALLKCPSMKDPGKRNALVNQLPEEIWSNMDRFAAAGFDVFALVDTCLQRPGGFTALVEALRVLDGSPAIQDVESLAARFGVWAETAP